MNCEQARENLTDLVYEEIDPSRRQEVADHLRACPRCRGEYRKLRQARAALAASRAGEPAGPVKARFWPGRWAAAAGGIAAMVAIALTLWMVFGPTGPEAFAQAVEIKRLSVSLTIMSRPEGRAGQSYPQRGQPSAQGGYRQQTDQGQWLASLPLAPLPPNRRGWWGLALVRDQRVIRNLSKGTTEVRFKDVPSAIKPDTVRLHSIDRPGALAILEQNYQYDLASAAAVLKRYVDKTVSVTFREGGSLTGTLLSFDGATLVIQPQGEGPRNVSRQEVKDIRFARLPEGLLTTPTLMWLLHSKRAARAQQFEVAYMTEGLNWRADYVLKLRLAEGKPAADEKDLPQIYDTADLVGYATVVNNSGITYEDAQLKLMAGDVNLIRPETDQYSFADDQWGGWGGRGAKPQFKEKAFFEYHLYTLGRRTTLRSAETKQIELVAGSGLKLRRLYVYDRNVNTTAARVVSEFKNSKENNLGKPLPKGVVRLYAPDPAGVQTFVAKTTIDHTPKDETVRFSWAFAFDIACSAKRVDYRRRGWDHHEKWQYSLRNTKDHDVTITVVIHVPAATYKFDCARPWKLEKVGWIELDVPVRANTVEKLVFSYSWNTRSGGGLQTPPAKRAARNPTR